MSEMSSFYGGRQGNSIVIAKRFDGINIPQVAGNYQYTKYYYATDKDGEFILTTDSSANGAIGVGTLNGSGEYVQSTSLFLIRKVNKNRLGEGIANFYEWTGHENDATQINSTNYVFYPELAQGMVQFFSQGARTASEVNYGAYVIIDTILNMSSPNNLDNGKVYRRGMDINSTDGLAGAEYIGQIVGPQGESPELDIDSYANVLEIDLHKNSSYNPLNDSIVPGSYIKEGIRYYEDEIKYAWATIRDEFGNNIGCKIGFKIPSLVQDFEAQSMSPYENRKIGGDGKYYNYDLLDEDSSQYDKEKNQWAHPYFQKWQIKVPHGYHGVDSENIEIIPSYTMTPKYKGSSIKIYNTEDCSDNDVYKEIVEENESYPILGSQYKYIKSESDIDSDDADGLKNFNNLYLKYYIRYGSEYNPDDTYSSCKIELDGGIKFVKKEDCYRKIIRYREKDYDDIESGITRYYYIGDYNVIDKVILNEDGYITVYYTASPQPENLEQALRWIDTKDSKGITIDNDGTVHIYYNTLHEEEDAETGKIIKVHDHQDYPTVLDWITQASLSQAGKFTILYNNDTVKIGENETGNKYETTLKWIDYIDFADDGTITFRWNSDEDRTGTPAYQFIKKVKYINDVQVQTTKKDSSDSRLDGYEGSGDQKIHINYNNDELDHSIGEPLNYIIETCISTPTAAFPDAPYSHFLVYYADPALRLKLKDKWVTYPSTKVIDTEAEDGTKIYHTWKEWVDLGECRGSSGGLHIIKNVSSLDDLKDSSGNYIPPEQLADSRGEVINPEGAGWGCTMDVEGADVKKILFYDYETKTWYSIGSLDSSSIDPTYILVMSKADNSQKPTDEETSLLKEKGIWLGLETCYFAS